jgi:PIN domain nuclease of toxin-antitoxin system
MPVVLDTCAWLWLCAAPHKLSRAARTAIDRARPDASLNVSVFSTWEIVKLVQKGKLDLALPCREWIVAAMRAEGITMHPVSPEVCLESTELPGVFHGDPADQIIVATARLLSVPVVTADRKIRAYRHVQSVW